MIKNISNFLVARLRFCFRKTIWKAKFSEFFLPLKESLVATFSETRASTFRKNVTEHGILMPNWSRTCQSFWTHSSIFALEKQPKNLNFQSFFTSKRSFRGYFHWIVCSYFEKICSWTRYSNAKLIKNISNFLITLFCFCFRKTNLKSKISEFLTSERPFRG